MLTIQYSEALPLAQHIMARFMHTSLDSMVPPISSMPQGLTHYWSGGWLKCVEQFSFPSVVLKNSVTGSGSISIKMTELMGHSARQINLTDQRSQQSTLNRISTSRIPSTDPFVLSFPIRDTIR